MNESDLRSALRLEAEHFDPQPGWLDELPPRRRRRLPRPAAALSAMTAAAVAAAVYVGALGPSGDGGLPPNHEATPTTGGTTGSTVTMRLVGYDGPVHGTLPRGLEEHLSCMRDHGYDIPDPEWTGNGWMLTLDDTRALGLGTLRWKRTVFITCALTRPGGDRLKGFRSDLLHPRARAVRGDGR